MKALTTLIRHVCMPDPSVCKDEEERNVLYIRNYVTLGIFSCLIIISPILQRILGISFHNGTILFELWISILISLIFLGRTHPKVFHLIFFVIISLAGPLILYFNKNIFKCTLTGVIIYPTYVFFVTGKSSLLLIAAIWQIFLLQFLYYPYILDVFKTENPLVLSHLFVTGVMYSAIVALFVNFFANGLLQNANQQIAILKETEEVAQRQMNFLMTLSHEIRNPLNSILGSIQSALFEDLSPIAVDFLRTAETCGELLLHLINNILDSGKAEVGDLEVNPCPTNVKETLERIWSICSTILKRKDIKGFLKIAKNVPKSLMLDPYRLTQILVNLVGNSAKFTDKGSITLSFRWIAHKQEVSDQCFEPIPYDDEDEGVFEREESNFHEEQFSFLQLNQKSFKPDERTIQQTNYSPGILKIVVKDTGQGIKEENLAKLFQKFSQVSNKLDHKKIGTGLGLYITKELVKRMNGEIRVYSKYGVGSSFIICIPCEQIHIPQILRNFSQPVLPTITELTLKIKAMIVDDDIANTRVFEHYLTQKKITTICIARNGLDAYEKYKNQAAKGELIDLVLMDISIPSMAGKAACKKIREFEMQNNIKPCILFAMTGNCLESEMNECLDPEGEIRAHEFLRKPIKFEELSSAIDRILDKCA